MPLGINFLPPRSQMFASVINEINVGRAASSDRKTRKRVTLGASSARPRKNGTIGRKLQLKVAKRNGSVFFLLEESVFSRVTTRVFFRRDRTDWTENIQCNGMRIDLNFEKIS